MTVAALLLEDQVRLIAHKQLMTAITDFQYRRIDLVAVTQADAVEIAANERRD